MKLCNSRNFSPPIFEALESRTFLSASGVIAGLPLGSVHPAAVSTAAKTVTPATKTTLTVAPHATKLGQDIVVTATVSATPRASSVAGEVEFLDQGVALVDPSGNPIAVAVGAKNRATYTFGVGNFALLTGKHTLTAEFLSSGSLPNSTSRSVTVNVSSLKGTTGSDGLQLAVVKRGAGRATVKSGNTVSVLYTGYLASNGRIFDYNNAHGASSQPFTFQAGAGQVITGFDEGVIGMKVGETRALGIPSAIGYGSSGAPPTIPANASLVFFIKLLSIS